jgi:predicted CXXCH cytochrome family protein
VSCHELTFDPDERSRQLPHGKPREVVATLLEYYARRFLDPGARAVIPRVRGPLPGSEDRDASAEVRCNDSVAACSRQAALAQIDSQFNVRGCHGCHRIVDTRAEDIKDRYQVLAVKLGNAFYPHAKFNHKSHLIQGRLTGDDACQSCHAAQKSTDATQVLMPGIERCVSCHSDVTRETAPTMLESAKAGTPRMTVPLGCVGCHDYHPGKLRD